MKRRYYNLTNEQRMEAKLDELIKMTEKIDILELITDRIKEMDRKIDSIYWKVNALEKQNKNKKSEDSCSHLKENENPYLHACEYCNPFTADRKSKKYGHL